MVHSKISVVVPCYNEEKIIYSTYKQIKKEADKIMDNYEIIFANDGSTDNTKKILEHIVAKDKKVRLISWNKNRGMGYAQKNLYRAAKGSLVIEMDADLSIKPTIFRDFMRYIEDYDVVIASKYKGIKGIIPLNRKIPSRVYYLVCKILFGITVKDVQSSFKIFRINVLENLNLKSDWYELHVELMYKLKQKGYKIKEIPAYYSHRSKGSKFNMLINGPQTLINTFLLWWKLKNNFKNR